MYPAPDHLYLTALAGCLTLQMPESHDTSIRSTEPAMDRQELENVRGKENPSPSSVSESSQVRTPPECLAPGVGQLFTGSFSI